MRPYLLYNHNIVWMSDSSDAGDSSAGECRPEDSPTDSDDPDYKLLEAALAAGHEARCHTPSSLGLSRTLRWFANSVFCNTQQSSGDESDHEVCLFPASSLWLVAPVQSLDVRVRPERRSGSAAVPPRPSLRLCPSKRWHSRPEWPAIQQSPRCVQRSGVQLSMRAPPSLYRGPVAPVAGEAPAGCAARAAGQPPPAVAHAAGASSSLVCMRSQCLL